MLVSKLLIALSVAACSLAAPAAEPQIVTLPTRLTAGAIIQTYPDVTTPLYDYIDATIGAPLRVVDTSYIKPSNGILGTQFDFVPVKSTYMAYTQSLTTAYGHIVLTSNTSLALTVSLTETPLTPRLAPVVKADSFLQLDQYWSYEHSTSVLIFLGSIYRQGKHSLSSIAISQTFAPVGYAPATPVHAPEEVQVTNVFSTKGRFVFKGGKTTNPCPPLTPFPPPETSKRDTIAVGGVVCPLS